MKALDYKIEFKTQCPYCKKWTTSSVAGEYVTCDFCLNDYSAYWAKIL